ncbi:LysE family translocator [Lacibacterium aquatile]|uniref:LysE family translocator n=1 Tax=Lacibacterium aquatile TaxID=1168082 RepID=A0ABW5DL25_9PROT
MIVSVGALGGFALVALGMVCTPGPNMIYLLSRSITQGRLAGVISLGGVVVGFLCYMLCAAFGLTALLLAVPMAYEVIQWAGAAYLLYMAWNSVKPGARSVLEPRHDLAIDGPRKLFAMGLFTNLLNPKVAVIYLSLLPQFIEPANGNILAQSIILGLTQILISFTVNLLIVLAAGSVSVWFTGRPRWQKVQRWVMASVLASLAIRLAMERRAV